MDIGEKKRKTRRKAEYEPSVAATGLTEGLSAGAVHKATQREARERRRREKEAAAAYEALYEVEYALKVLRKHGFLRETLESWVLPEEAKAARPEIEGPAIRLLKGSDRP
jgi:hypothetical protein